MEGKKRFQCKGITRDGHRCNWDASIQGMCVSHWYAKKYGNKKKKKVKK